MSFAVAAAAAATAAALETVYPAEPVSSPRYVGDNHQMDVTNDDPSVDPLAEIAAAFQAGVEVKDRTYRFKTYRQCFVGSAAVDYLLTHGGDSCTTRIEAVALGQSLMDDLQLFEHVTRDHPFADAPLFYRFVSISDRSDVKRNDATIIRQSAPSDFLSANNDPPSTSSSSSNNNNNTILNRQPQFPRPELAPMSDKEAHAAQQVWPLDEYNTILLNNVHPAEWQDPAPNRGPDTSHYDLVVIGGGPAGLITAAGAAGVGAKVALIEAHLLGGDCLNVGCVPSKTLLHAAHLAHTVRSNSDYLTTAGIFLNQPIKKNEPTVEPSLGPVETAESTPEPYYETEESSPEPVDTDELSPGPVEETEESSPEPVDTDEPTPYHETDEPSPGPVEETEEPSPKPVDTDEPMPHHETDEPSPGPTEMPTHYHTELTDEPTPEPYYETEQPTPQPVETDEPSPRPVETAEPFAAPVAVTVDFGKVMERVRAVRAQISHHDSAQRYSQELGVEVYIGRAVFTSETSVLVNGRTLTFKRAAICTGASPNVVLMNGLQELYDEAKLMPVVPPLPPPSSLSSITQPMVMTNETFFNMTVAPRHLVILGAGVIGMELAQAMQRLGIPTTVLGRSGKVLPKEDADLAQIVQQQMIEDGVTFRLNVAEYQKIELTGTYYDNGYPELKVTLLEKDQYEPVEILCDAFLVAAGRRPNVSGLNLEAAKVKYDVTSGLVVNDRLQTSNPRIYGVGDCCSEYKFTHAADFMARAVIRNALFFGKVKMSNLLIPYATYTSPEIASVGLYEADLRARGREFRVFEKHFKDNDRSVADDATIGLVRIRVDAKTDEILGASIVGAQAGNLISEVTLAMQSGTGLSALANVIHPYPTTAEAIRQTGDLYNRTKLTNTTRKVLRGIVQLQR